MSEKEFKEKVMQIMRDNIYFSAQADSFLVHGAVNKIWELVNEHFEEKPTT